MIATRSNIDISTEGVETDKWTSPWLHAMVCEYERSSPRSGIARVTGASDSASVSLLCEPLPIEDDLPIDQSEVGRSWQELDLLLLKSIKSRFVAITRRRGPTASTIESFPTLRKTELTRKERYRRAALLLQQWSQETGDYDEKTWPLVETELKKEGGISFQEKF